MATSITDLFYGPNVVHSFLKKSWDPTLGFPDPETIGFFAIASNNGVNPDDTITYKEGDAIAFYEGNWVRFSRNGVSTVNGDDGGITGEVVLTTDDISEDGTPINLWYTDQRARDAIVRQTVININTTTCPSEAVVHTFVTEKIKHSILIPYNVANWVINDGGNASNNIWAPSIDAVGQKFKSIDQTAATKLPKTADTVYINDPISVINSSHNGKLVKLGTAVTQIQFDDISGNLMRYEGFQCAIVSTGGSNKTVSAVGSTVVVNSQYPSHNKLKGTLGSMMTVITIDISNPPVGNWRICYQGATTL